MSNSELEPITAGYTGSDDSEPFQWESPIWDREYQELWESYEEAEIRVVAKKQDETPVYLFDPGNPRGSGNGGAVGSQAVHNQVADTETISLTSPNLLAQIVRSKIQALNWVNFWVDFEYGTALVKYGNDPFKVGDSKIYTSNQAREVSFNLPPQDASNPVSSIKILHNHPDNLGDAYQDAVSRHPSDNDWVSALAAYNYYGGTDTSVIIMDAVGSLREFNIQDMTQYLMMSTQDMINGVNLPPEIM